MRKIEKMNKKPQLKIHKPGESKEKIFQQSEVLYRSIVEDQTEFINRFKPDGTIVFVNEACCRYFQKRYDEFFGTNFMPLLPAEDQEKLKQLLLSLTPENPVATLEHKVITPEGEICWQKWTNRGIFDEKGNIAEFQAVGRDITERKRTEQALAESEQLYRDLFANAPVGLGIADKHGNIIAYNDAILAPGGYTREEFGKMKNVSELYYNREERSKILAIAGKQGFLHRHPVQLKRKDGTPYDTLLSLRFIIYQRIPCVQATVEDITERQKAENLLESYRNQLSLLTSRLALIEEKERRKIAVDLHDNIGQILAYANMMLTDLKISAPGDFRNSLEEIRLLIQQSIEYTRSLTFRLGTPLLYEIGLESAVEGLGQEFQKKYGVIFTLQDVKKAKPLQDDVRTVLFQSIRELLTNVVKHAGAHGVTVSLKRKNHSIQVTVADDGVGFDVASICDEYYLKCGFGLFSIRERLKNIGGGIRITSEPGSRTLVTITAPLKEGKETGDNE